MKPTSPSAGSSAGAEGDVEGAGAFALLQLQPLHSGTRG
jgi:hypothetical protein